MDKNAPPSESEVKTFLQEIDFNLPEGFIDFFKTTNGADLDSDEFYTLLWPLTEMVELNKDYDVQEYAPEFFIFGSDGGDTAFAIEKATGDIFEMPFIGMSREEASFVSKTFSEFLNARES